MSLSGKGQDTHLQQLAKAGGGIATPHPSISINLPSVFAFFSLPLGLA